MALQTAEGWIALRFYSRIFLVLKLYLQLGELPYRKIDLIKLTTLLLISSKKANHSCLNQFACSVLCIYFCQNSWSLAATFLGASQLFSIIPLIAEAASLLCPHSTYYLYYRPCICSEQQFLQQVWALIDFPLLSSQRFKVQTKN